jgi:hypothetical protein
MKIFLDTFWKAGLPFGVIMTLFFVLSSDWVSGLITGLVSGCLFGAIMAGFVAFKAQKFTADRPLEPDEKLLKEGPANHSVGGEAVGGWIYLTDRRFYFRPHGANVQNHEYIVPVSELAEAEKGNSFKIIPNRLTIQLKNGEVENFVVKNVGSWVEAIRLIK